ncbi:MAG: isocitrate lyase/phosphoenolpyruvate mutase family protein, partial [Rhodobacteraceae bacterium]|nr:isocitrate lyase/phosphoenolpyruvate mutase family protein [Paracoccaceae bacterium]
VTDLPVTMDFEGGYATTPKAITKNVAQMLQTGAIGLNFEDQIIGKGGLYPIETQGARITAVRAASSDLFINSRTDLFLKESDKTKHANLMDEAISRAQTYHASGADCFFVPGLVDTKLISALCKTLPMPVNIMKSPDAPTNEVLANLGVSRISYGPFPYFASMAALSEQVQTL